MLFRACVADRSAKLGGYRNTIALDVLITFEAALWIMTPTARLAPPEIALPSLGAASTRPVDRYTSDQSRTYQDS